MCQSLKKYWFHWSGRSLGTIWATGWVGLLPTWGRQILEAELGGLLFGPKLAIKTGIMDIVIEMDSEPHFE